MENGVRLLDLTIDLGVPVDVLYIDFEKAFDKVPHSLLLDKPRIIGLRGNLLNWYISYLSNRKQRVELGTYFSDWLIVKSDIPQGSVLDPILFLISPILSRKFMECVHTFALPWKLVSNK